MSRMKLRSAVAWIVLVAPFAVAAQTPDFTLKEVGNGVYAAIGVPGGKAGSNAGFIIGSNGVLVVDTFLDAPPAQELLAEIRKLTSLPVRYVVNTHYHLDHTGGNRVFADAGASIVAHKNVRAWERTENLKFFGPTPTAEQKARVETLAVPDVVYSDAVDLYLGDRLVQVRYMLGHTGGDSVVSVPDAKVVFTGDLFWHARLPNLIDASTKAWIDTLERLAADHTSAKFVSGHGDVGTVDDVRTFRDYLIFLRQQIAQAQREGKSGQTLEDAVLPQLQTRYGTWGSFTNFAKRNLDQTADELQGTKRIPVPPQP
jgi:glyoxylase-like metal-dependent hydrolase (beta-lactamase superfamily II)